MRSVEDGAGAAAEDRRGEVQAAGEGEQAEAGRSEARVRGGHRPPPVLHRPADRGQEGDQPEVRDPDHRVEEHRAQEQGEREGHRVQAQHGAQQGQADQRVLGQAQEGEVDGSES